jgi:cellulose biosynthesis protein BcsQ/nucleoside phosphorylase
MGQVITFYSYKGGVGRTMAMANVAVLLYRWGHKVLTVDWDLEAPGLEFFYKDFIDVEDVCSREGVIDILTKASVGNGRSSVPKNWSQSLINIKIPGHQGALHLLTSGRRGDGYFAKVRGLDLQEFYAKHGGLFIESLRDEWRRAYDFVLIDSRTGITDIGGICTIQLPDVLVTLFTATQQSLRGVVDVFNKAKAARRNLPVDRPSLLAVPVPSKFDTGTEFIISQEWLDRFAEELSPFYANWLPVSVKRRDFLAATKIPYIPYFSFGEKLPVLEEGTIDPAGLGYAYETLAALIANNLDYAEQVMEQRDELIRYAFKGAVRSKPATGESVREKKPAVQLGPRIFLSYTVEDRNKVAELYKELTNAGYRPWMDVMDLLPGERWKTSIADAIKRSDFFLVCLSSNAVNKGGFLQKEIKIALDVHEEKAAGASWLIPVRLDDSPVPNRLHTFHWLNLFESDGLQRLLQAIEAGHRRQEAGTALVLTSSPVEYDAVRNYLTNLREETLPDGTVCEIGRLSAEGRSWEVGVLELDAYGPKVALEAGRTIQFVNPSVVISVGSGASVKNARPGDVVVATKVYRYEESERGKGQPLLTSIGSSSYRLEQRARAEAKRIEWLSRRGTGNSHPRVLLGTVVVSDKISTLNRSTLQKFLRSKLPDAISFDLIGTNLLSAIFADKDIDILVVRGVTEILDSEGIAGDGIASEAARNAGAFTFEVLSKVEGERSASMSGGTPVTVSKAKRPTKPKHPNSAGKKRLRSR